MSVAEVSWQDIPPIGVFDEGFQRDPYPALAQARRAGPIARDAFGNLIVLHIDEFEAVATDPRFRAYGDSLAVMLGVTSGPTYDWLAGSLLFLDPPDHTRLRGWSAASSPLAGSPRCDPPSPPPPTGCWTRWPRRGRWRSSGTSPPNSRC